MVESGGQNQMWPTSGQSGNIALAVWGLPDALKQGTKSPVARKHIGWLHHTCCLGCHQCFRVRESKVAQKWAPWLNNTCRSGDLQCFGAGDKNRCG